MAGGRARFDDNGQSSLLAASNADGVTPVVIYADPSSHALLISGSLTIGGSAIPASGATTAVTVQIVDGSGNQITSFGGGTQYTDGGTPPTHPIGPTIIWDNGGAWQHVSAANPLPVTGGGGGTQYTNGATQATPVGNVTLGYDGANVRALLTDTTGKLSVLAAQGTAAALASGWPVINGELSDTTGTFTNATQTTSVTATGLDGYGNVLVSINGTYGTATAVFEGSDDGGTTWYGISEADRTDSNIIESGYTNLTNTSRAWQISNPGWDSIRVRSTAVATGTVNVRISPSSAPTSAGASVSIGTQLPAGTNLVGKMGIDQTTPGTTNNVSLSASSGAGTSILVKDITQFGDGSTSGILAVGLELYRAGSTDYARAQGDTTSGLWVNVKAAAANASTNVAQINGVTPLMGNGVTGTGSQRVTIASDNTAFSVNATLSAETTKVIGVTRTADGSGNLLTSTASALDVNVKSGSVANTGFIATQTDTVGSTTAFIITLASLATSTVGVGRQSTLVTSNTARSALIACKITMGTTPTINTLIYVYLIRGDGTLNDDNAGASDAGLTIINAPLLGTILCSAATSNVSYYGVFDTKFLGSLGPSFGIAVVNSSGAALNATAGNFTCEYTKLT